MRISINNPDATVTVNGLLFNVAEPRLMHFGEYRVVAQSAGYISFDEVVDFRTNNQEIRIDLQPEPPVVQYGRVYIRSYPAGALVFVDNIFHGTTPIEVTVPQGMRHVSIQMSGFTATETVVHVGSTLTQLPIYELQRLATTPQPGGNHIPEIILPPGGNQLPAYPDLPVIPDPPPIIIIDDDPPDLSFVP
jgi:hypothetical protein